MTSYPPTCQEILEDDRPVQPPSYEDSIKPAAATRSGTSTHYILVPVKFYFVSRQFAFFVVVHMKACVIVHKYGTSGITTLY